MSTPKPGQIRCPTCLRSTPPATYCTQCGSPIPPSARTRPRGLDRDELEERVRRRPGEGAFRRGSSPDDPGSRGGYVPFEPEPEDALAVRAEEEEEGTRRIDNVPAHDPGPPPAWPAEPGFAAHAGPPRAEPGRAEPAYQSPAGDEAPYDQAPYDEAPYEDAEEPYPYTYPLRSDRGDGGGSSALPIIGFVVLCVLALAVGAVLAGLLGGDDGVGDATLSPSPSAEASENVEPSQAPASEGPASEEPATPEPTDGPVAFPDGARLAVQPCATRDFRQEAVGRPDENACAVDGSTVADGTVVALVNFSSVAGSDTVRVRLVSGGETLLEEETTIGSVLGSCGETCNGLIYGAQYEGLDPGEYELVLHRNGDFADRATVVVED